MIDALVMGFAAGAHALVCLLCIVTFITEAVPVVQPGALFLSASRCLFHRRSGTFKVRVDTFTGRVLCARPPSMADRCREGLPGAKVASFQMLHLFTQVSQKFTLMKLPSGEMSISY